MIFCAQLLLCAWVLLVLQVFLHARSTTLRVVNSAGHPIDVLWSDESSKSLISQLPQPLPNGSTAVLDTFENHQFVIRLLTEDSDTTNQLETMIRKKSIDETAIVTFNEMKKELSVTIPDRHDWMRKKVHRLLSTTCAASAAQSEKELVQCIREGIAPDLQRLHEEKTTLRKLQDDISMRLRNYTCADDDLETTTPEYSYEVTVYGRTYTVNVLLDMPHAKIWFVENFVTPEECAIFETHGKPILHRATVAAEDGTSVVSEHRKAQQASYDFHQQAGEHDPVWNLQQRLLSLTNFHCNYSLDTPGQEGFTIIQYNPSDEYFPHCDGSCDNSLHMKTGRVATAVMYCKSPERGGATVFTRSNIAVKPKPGAVTFFAYKGADGRMDDGYTEHTGCPVREGEKWITTFWMREGVTAEENWTLYDPSGIRILESS